MRAIAKSTLMKFWSQPERANSKGALQSRYAEAIKASWETPQEIEGNTGIAWLKFVGTDVPIARGTSICELSLGEKHIDMQTFQVFKTWKV